MSSFHLSAKAPSLRLAQAPLSGILKATIIGLCLALSGCAAPTAVIRPLFPPSADLAVEPKPAPPADIVTSAQAAAEYDIAVEGWGERGWLQIGRVCRWAVENGAQGLACPQ